MPDQSDAGTPDSACSTGQCTAPAKEQGSAEQSAYDANTKAALQAQGARESKPAASFGERNNVHQKPGGK